MKTKVVFYWAWGIFFVVLTIAIISVTTGISSGINAHYSSVKTEILVRADSLVSQVQTPRNELLLKADLIWNEKGVVGEKAKELLKVEHPIFNFIIFKGNIYHLLWLILLFPVLIWSNKLTVLPEWELVAEWGSKKMKPFKNGYHFPFRYFGFFEEIADVPVNKQTLYILSGRREGLEQEIINTYVYGTASDIEPGSGSALRLSYRVEFECLDSSALTYNIEGPYEYVVSVIEQHVGMYVHRRKSEVVIDRFSKQTLDKIVPIIVQNRILAETGIKLLLFIPVDVYNTPESAAMRTELEKVQREGALISARIENNVKAEAGKHGVLLKELANMAVKKNIAGENDNIRSNKVKSIIADAGVSGSEALKIVIKEQTLETVGAAAKNGSIVYIDESSNGKGNLNQGAALGFALNATQKKS